MFICSSLNQRFSKVIITCVYESLYASIMNKILRAGFSNANQYSQLVNGPPPLIFEHRCLTWARIKDKSATNVSAREVGSRKKNNTGLPRKFQTIHTHFSFSLNECDDKDFCLRIFAKPENKITETKKGEKITPIVLLFLSCFFAVEQLAQSEIIFKTVKRSKRKTCLLADRHSSILDFRFRRSRRNCSPCTNFKQKSFSK